jgi:hypothetical protein
MDTRPTTEELLEAVSPMRSVPRLYGDTDSQLVDSDV